MLSYLKFLIKSTNQHGVHSPFVYEYLTKCLYQKPHLSKNKLNNVILKSVAYFNCKSVLVDDADIKDRLHSLNHEPPYDLVVYDNFNLYDLLQMLKNNQVHNDTLIVIQNLRKQLGEWKKAITNPKITVSVDCFSFGILFVRNEQVKEHFTIRL